MRKWLALVVLCVGSSAWAIEIPDEYDVLSIFPGSVAFQYGTWIDLPKSGIVKQVQFLRGGKVKAKYVNETEQRVKPDIIIWVLNKDGIIIWEGTDAWLMSSMDPEDEYEQSWSCAFHIDPKFAFSKWAQYAWDLEPRFILVVGSKYAYKKLMKRTLERVVQLNQTQR